MRLEALEDRTLLTTPPLTIIGGNTATSATFSADAALALGLNSTQTGSDSLTISVQVNNASAGLQLATPFVFSGDQFAVMHYVTFSNGVTGVTMTNFGSGYTAAPTVTFSGGGGSGAVGVASFVPDGVVGLTAISGGTGYTVGEAVTITDGSTGTGATGTVTAIGASGAITAVSITSPGSGYDAMPDSVTITPTSGGDPGSGATATATVSGVVTGVVITTAGSGYTSAPIVTFSAPTNSGMTANGTANGADLQSFSNGVTSVTMTNFGSGYTAAPMVTISGGGGSGAVGTANFVDDGVIGLTAISGGTDYTVGEAVTIADGSTGTGATGIVTAISTGGVITAVSITSPGSGYDGMPDSVTITPTSGGDPGSGATATATVSGVVTGVTITTPGSGYTSAPTVTFSAPTNSGTTATGTANGTQGDVVVELFTAGGNNPAAERFITLATQNVASDGTLGDPTFSVPFVTRVTITNGGSGYTAAPTVTFGAPTTSGGTTATGVAVLGSGATANQVVGITITNEGSGYTSAPTITFNNSGTGGSFATATASDSGAAYYTNRPVFRVANLTNEPNGNILQTGDANGNSSSPLPNLLDQFDPFLGFNGAGVLAEANTGLGNNSGNGQWFITQGPTQHLNQHHDIFGQVVEGMDVVNQIMALGSGGSTLASVDITAEPQDGTIEVRSLNGTGGTATLHIVVTDNTNPTSSFTDDYNITVLGANASTVQDMGTNTALNVNPQLAGLTDAGNSAFASEVTSVTITNGGSGYTSAPTVTFSAPGGTGTTATGTAILGTGATAGQVVGVTFTNPGTGYTAAPMVTFSAPGGSGTLATGTTSIGLSFGTGVTSVTISSGGSGYTSAPTVTFSAPGAGTTATGIAIVNSGAVTGVSITNPGSGYTTAPTFTFNNTGSGGSGATPGTTSLSVFSVTASAPSGFTQPTVFSQGTATGQISVSGSNLLFDNTTIGSFTGGGTTGSPLVVTFNSLATPAALQALQLTITAPGGYFGSFDVDVTSSRLVDAYHANQEFHLTREFFPNSVVAGAAPLNFGGSPSQQTGEFRGIGEATALVGSTLYVADGTAGLEIYDLTNINNPLLVGHISTIGFAWDVEVVQGLGVSITSGGSGYTAAPTVTITGGGGTGATGTAVLGTGSFAGEVVSVTITNQGSGYTSAPTITFDNTNSGGSGASGTGRIRTAFVADDATGLVSIDVSDPANPKQLGILPMPAATDTTGGGTTAAPGLAMSLAIDGKTAYVAAFQGGFNVVNISDPANMTVTTPVTTGIKHAVSIAESGGDIYVSDAATGILVFDASKLTTPNAGLIAKVPQSSTFNPWGLALANGNLYVADQTSGAFDLDIYSTVPVPGSPGTTPTLSLLGQISLSTKPVQVAVSADGSTVVVGTQANALPGVTAVTVINGGSGYTAPPMVTFSAPSNGGTPASGTAVLGTGATATQVASVTISSAGSGYTSAPTVTFGAPTGGGTTATGVASISPLTQSGFTLIDVTDPTSPHLVDTINGGTASSTSNFPTTADLVSVSVTSGGSGYTSAPLVTFGPPTSSGSTATGFAVLGTAGQVVSVIVTNSGSGYTTSSAPSVTFTGGGGSGASATATVAARPTTNQFLGGSQASFGVSNLLALPFAGSATEVLAVTPTTTFTGTQGFIDEHGTSVNITVVGATARVIQSSTGHIESLDIFNTNGTATLTITTSGGTGTTTIDTLDVAVTDPQNKTSIDNGCIKSIVAPTVNIDQAVTITGSIGTLTLGNVSSATIKIGNAFSGDSNAATSAAITLGNVADTSLTAPISLSALTVKQWTGGGLITAPLITTLKSTGTGDFAANLTLSPPPTRARGGALALSQATITGAVTGTWQITGRAGTISAGSTSSTWAGTFTGSVESFSTTGNFSGTFTATAVGTLKVGGDMTGATVNLTEPVGTVLDISTLTIHGTMDTSTLRAVGNIGTVTVGAMSASQIYAGIDSSVAAGALPVSGQLDFPLARITSITVKGSFGTSVIAAGTIGTVIITSVENPTSSTFGVVAHSIGLYIRKGTGAKTVSSSTNNSSTPKVIDGSASPGNYVAEVIQVIIANPTSSVTFPVDGHSYNTAGWTGTITGTASDPTGVQKVDVSIEDTTTTKWWDGSGFNNTIQTFVPATFVPATNSWSLPLIASKLTDGNSYKVQSRTTDSIGKVQTSLGTANFSFDTTAPTLSSINRANPSPTNATSVSWTVTFSEKVTGLKASNFALKSTPNSVVNIASVTSSDGGLTWTVSVTSGIASANGTLELDLANNTGVTDLAGNALTTSTINGQAYTLDHTAPTSIVTFPANGASYTTAAWTTAGAAITGTAADTGSGVQKVEVSIKDTSTGKWWNGTGFTATSQTFVLATVTTGWSLAFSASHLTAAHHYTVQSRATDNAGNVETSLTSKSFTFTG